jgi:hypothetical protein
MLTGLQGVLDDVRGLGATTTFNGMFQDIEYSGTIQGTSLVPGLAFNGVNLRGGFFGPNADEFAAVFETNQQLVMIGSDEFSSIITGVALGKRN